MSNNQSLHNLRPEDIKANLALLSRWGVRQHHWNSAREPDGQLRLKRAANALKGWMYADSISWQEARDIMKPTQFFGPRQWNQYFRIEFSRKQLDQIEEFPWSAETLNHRYSDRQYEGGKFMYPMDHECYFAFLAPDYWVDGDPLTILKWYQILQQRSKKYASSPVLDARHSSYAGWLGIKDGFAEKGSPPESYRQVVTETTPKFGWYLMRIADVQGVWMGEKDHEYSELLIANHRTTTAIGRILMHSCYFLLNGSYVKQGGDDYHGGVCVDEPREPGISGRSLLPRPQVRASDRGICLGDDSFLSQHQDTRHYSLTRVPGH